MKKLWIAAALAAFLSVCAMAQGPTVWQIDPAHANAQFVVRHLGISNVQGQFTKITGRAEIDDKDPTKSSVTATIDVNSIDTRVAARDADLKSPNFFDAAKYPTMTFQSNKITAIGDGRLQMTGNLTIHGVTRPATFDVENLTPPIQDPWGGVRRGVTATTKINRQDFGLTYDKKSTAGELLIGDQVTITLDVELVKKS